LPEIQVDQFVYLMGHTGNYTREEAIAAEKEVQQTWESSR
jgi:hypothetical protein